MNQKGGIIIYPKLFNSAWTQSLTHDARYFYFLFYMMECDHAGFLVYNRPKEWMGKLDWNKERLEVVIKDILLDYEDEQGKQRPSKIIQRGKVFWNSNYMEHQGHLKPRPHSRPNLSLKPAIESIHKFRGTFPEAVEMIKRSKVGSLYNGFFELKPLETNLNPKQAKDSSPERMYANFARTFGSTPNPSEIQTYELLIKADFTDDEIYDAMHIAATAKANMRYALKVLENKYKGKGKKGILEDF